MNKLIEAMESLPHEWRNNTPWVKYTDVVALARQLDERHPELLDPEMPEQELRLHMGELTDSEIQIARAAVKWANSRQLDKAGVDEGDVRSKMHRLASTTYPYCKDQEKAFALGADCALDWFQRISTPQSAPSAEVVKRVTNALMNCFKSQFNGHRIPGDVSRDSWTAKDDVFSCDMGLMAIAALAAMQEASK